MKTREIALVAAALLAAACGGKGPAPAKDASSASRPARSVNVVAVGTAGAGAATVPGTVQARQRAVLSSRIQASVLELPLREGQGVEAGAVVARLDSEALRSAVQAAEAGASAAESDRVRFETLAASGAATPREREMAQSRAAAAAAAVSAARDALAYAVLRAPFAGVVAERPARLGDVVGPGQPVIVIEGRGTLEVVASVPAQAVAALKVGDRLPLRVDGRSDAATARIASIAPAADPVTHRVEIRADLDSGSELRSGAFVRIELPIAIGADESARLTVPATALFERGGLVGAFVADGDVARLRWVARGGGVGDAVEVRAGLTAGERVIVSPEGLADGDRIVVAGGAQ
ncbi:MAG: efflux RND transporter periplasmic adaptor subunit [Vicinamibacteria bacterium]|jgi:RND family efflux transporter MFP subunit|nr:efflux RND transporter periplasmic adaptor subunit [Vicinamibacteria bacterium]